MSRTFVHKIRVRYGECDPQGVVFNANYVAYFDIVLTELYREALGSYQAMLDAGTDLVVAEVTVRFRAPAGFDDELAFEASILRLGTTGMKIRMECRKDDTLVVEGEIRHVFIDPATKAKMPMPDHIRRALEPYLVRDEDAAASAA